MTAFEGSAVASSWQPIETAPKVKGNCFWCLLAFGPEEDQSIGLGLRWDGRWFAAATFYCLGRGRKYKWREVEVKPTHWMPLPAPPEAP